jgi:hypothetical protein
VCVCVCVGELVVEVGDCVTGCRACGAFSFLGENHATEKYACLALARSLTHTHTHTHTHTPTLLTQTTPELGKEAAQVQALLWFFPDLEPDTLVSMFNTLGNDAALLANYLHMKGWGRVELCKSGSSAKLTRRRFRFNSPRRLNLGLSATLSPRRMSLS